ncbi:MAG: nadE [Ignavibacteria bacterium]|nr:nadE [Ignavibacteria bacterium]
MQKKNKQFSPSTYGFLRCGVASPEILVADIEFNTKKIIELIDDAVKAGCFFIVFPELSLTGYTCADLFLQKTLLDSCYPAISEIAHHTAKTKSTIILGAPIRSGGKLFNCAFFISQGEIKGIVPKTFICNYSEYYEKRWFASSKERTENEILIEGKPVPFGEDLLFEAENFPDCRIGIEICEDLWAVVPPSFSQSLAGATILANLSASSEALGKQEYRRELVKGQSARCFALYLYSAAGSGESTTDLAFGGGSIIAENGLILSETDRFSFDSCISYADCDLELMTSERMRNTSFGFEDQKMKYRKITFTLHEEKAGELLRSYPKMPFVPASIEKRSENCREIFSLQSVGLSKRIKHIGLRNVTLGISGGLDSTLALLVCVKSFDKLNLPRAGIHAISMPGFGTSTRTKDNCKALAKLLGVSFREISIIDTVDAHFKDISHDPKNHDIVFENAQARRRTHILMDIANQVGGIVVGTGDLSEIALGWSTYSGDHISMYGVNSGVPKTLVNYLIEWCAEQEFTGKTSLILHDICNTPISPELLPAGSDGEILQQTEKTIGPYILHDFFLYFSIRKNFSPDKILFIANHTFGDIYQEKEIKKWLRVFYERFFANQFKRSCMPDGVKVGTVALSPRGDWRMPSDASAKVWLDKLK